MDKYPMESRAGRYVKLLMFYNVESIPDLIDAMEKHIAKLQSSLPELKDQFPKTPREG